MSDLSKFVDNYLRKCLVRLIINRDGYCLCGSNERIDEIIILTHLNSDKHIEWECKNDIEPCEFG